MVLSKLYGDENKVIYATEIRKRILRFIEPLEFINSSPVHHRYMRVKEKIQNVIWASWFIKYENCTLKAHSAIHLVNIIWETEGW